MEEYLAGLSEEEAGQRRERGEGEKQTERITKSVPQIIKDNLFTLFNFLNFLIAALLFVVGAYSNMLFIAIIILNIIIGTAQELKAKKLVDELSILNRPVVRLIREGRERQAAQEEVVKGDLVVLESGSQICNDAVVVNGTIEVNESLLTGESDPVPKGEGGELYSGSFVMAGKAYARVTHVGEENYAAKLVSEVRKEKRVESELLGSMRRVTNFTSVCIIPLGVFLFLEAMLWRHTPVDEAVVSSAAALLGMLPKGLVLLISVSLAAGVIRLSRMKILVQNIFSLETLAHVDTLCLDKTGTLTDGKLKICSIIPADVLPAGDAEQLAGADMAACSDNNATFLALREAFPENEAYRPEHCIPFSSVRKWGCISFPGAGTVFAGAPEKLFGQLPANLERELEKGRRIVALGYWGQGWEEEDSLPAKIIPLFYVVLEDHIRRDAGKTLEFFRKEGVDVKIISGDHVKTVSTIAKRAGLRGWRNAVDMSALGGEPDYDGLCLRYTVFARTTPRQKQELVKALKRQGRHVGMTGDGVNDLLALREADCSIAVADGSDASRQIAQIVLLDSDFTNLPQVVMEGRRVIHNVTRTAQVFFIKTIYSVLTSLFCLCTGLAFPFIPIQITLIDACIEAWPSFLTILEADTGRVKGRFLKTALSGAAPFGAAVTIMIAVVSLVSPFSEAENRTLMYLLLILISMTAVIRSCIPFNRLRIFVCVTMALGCFGALAVLPSLFELSSLTVPMAWCLIAGTLAAGIFIGLWEAARKLTEERGKAEMAGK